MKSRYSSLRKDVVDSVADPKKRAVVLATLDDVFVKVQEVMGSPYIPIPDGPKFEESIVPVIRSGEKLMVDARTMHNFLDVGRDFSNWFKDRVETYGWIEGEDYFVVLDAKSPKLDSPNLANQDRSSWGGDRRSVDYHLTLSMAKELGMVENNEMGRRIRKYFIECEDRLMDYYKQEIASLGSRHEHDCSSLDWLREKSLDKIDAEAVVTLRDMWLEERASRLDFMSETYKEVDIRHKGTAKEVLTFLRPQLKYALNRLRGALTQLTKYHGLSYDSVLVMRLEGVIEDFSFVEQWVRKQ